MKMVDYGSMALSLSMVILNTMGLLHKIEIMKMYALGQETQDISRTVHKRPAHKAEQTQKSVLTYSDTVSKKDEMSSQCI